MFRKILFPASIFILLTGHIQLFGQNQKINGYRGIWYSNGQFQEYGYKFSGGVATFASRHKPIAIYSPEVNKTFFVYGGTTSADERHLLIMISYFDHKTREVPKPVVVLDKLGVYEPHDNASLSIDRNGFLWVFISGRFRTRPGFIFKSSKPYSIESFDKIVEWEMLSPQPWWINDRGFLLMYTKFRKGRDIYWSSSPDGHTWTESQKLAEVGGSFQVSSVFGNKLVTVFNYHPGGNVDKRTNLYLLQTEDMGITWKTIENKIMKTPVTEVENEALIKNYEAEGKLVYICDLNFDKYGNPIILAVLSKSISPGPDMGPREWMIINYRDNNWNFSKVCESTHNYDMGSLYVEGDEWRIIGPTEPGPQKYGTGGELALWVSDDGGINWKKSHNITENSPSNNSFVRRPLNADKDFYALWADGDADKFSISRLYFTNEKCNHVWVLPYEMTKAFEKPARIR